ncbi:hypothetical protein CVD28_00300 [Bacillus sp. M6-12]|uniref:hypothetical protein n=1 Tax=Bacillus sp. M6-12 TaxID=2054166 RepID=UPI000C76CF92|nr:hypothetical protein [Bacillus sp. M6-12]PLS18876.1 hypothetical protein CVD28_00300 [Bacillus sp. M6-12]
MPNYIRNTKMKAIQFIEKEYAENTSYYPGVFDKAMLSELWWGKTAEDGRYYIPNPFSHSFVLESTTLREGDYIITEESGYVYTLPKEVFEENHELTKEEASKKDYDIMTGSEGLE